VTEVPVKDYVDAQDAANRRLGAVVVVGVLAVMFTLHLTTSKALTVAFASAGKALDVHNDIIRSGERKEATFITRGQVYSALATSLVLTGLALTFYATFR
jgi:hypothetical protein